MSSGRSSEGPSSRPPVEKELDPRASAKNESQQLLEEVLQATLQLSSADEPVRSEDLRKLAAAARRRCGEPFSVDTVTELVETVLRLRFRRVVESSALWDRMTRQIAATIYDDPQAQQRMRAFWQRLCEVTP